MYVCVKCGRRFEGNYCPDCGFPVKPAIEGDFKVLPSDSGHKITRETVSIISLLLKFFLTPVNSTLQLASHSSFDQKSFLLGSIVIYFPIGLYARYQITNDFILASVSMLQMFVLVLIHIGLIYYVFRYCSRTLRNWAEYIAMICVIQGTTFLILGLGQGLWLLESKAAEAISIVAQMIILIPYWALVLGRFWSINSIYAYLIYIFSMLIVEVVLSLLIFPSFNDYVNKGIELIYPFIFPR